MSRLLNIALLTIIIFGLSGYVLWVYDYNQQVEYEANHPRLPIQINDTKQGVYYNGSLYTVINYTKTYNIHFINEKYTQYEIIPMNGSDYTNADININMSYIKQVRQENNTMIISIRKD